MSDLKVATFNQLCDVAEGKKSRLDTTFGGRNPDQQATHVLVLNTGNDVGPFTPLWVTDVVLPGETSSTLEVDSSTLDFASTNKTALIFRARLGRLDLTETLVVTTEPIPENGVGWAVISGAVPCWCEIADATDGYLDHDGAALIGDNPGLMSGVSGPAKIITKLDAEDEGERKLCVILLGESNQEIRKACMIGDLKEGQNGTSAQAWLMNPLGGGCGNEGNSPLWERSDNQICVWGDSGLRGVLFGSQNYYYTDPGLDETEQAALRDGSNGTPVDVYYSAKAQRWYPLGAGMTFLRGGIIDDGGACYSVIVGAPKVFGQYQSGLPRFYINCADIDWCDISPGEHVGEGVNLQWVNSLSRWYATLGCAAPEPTTTTTTTTTTTPPHCCDQIPDSFPFIVYGIAECDFGDQEVTMTQIGDNVWQWSGTLNCGDAFTVTLTCNRNLADEGCTPFTLHYTYPCASFDEDVSITDCVCDPFTFTGDIVDFGDTSACECCDEPFVCQENDCGTCIKQWNASEEQWQTFSFDCTGECTDCCQVGEPGTENGEQVTVGCCNDEGEHPCL